MYVQHATYILQQRLIYDKSPWTLSSQILVYQSKSNDICKGDDAKMGDSWLNTHLGQLLIQFIR